MFHVLHLQFVTLYVLQVGRDVGLLPLSEFFPRNNIVLVSVSPTSVSSPVGHLLLPHFRELEHGTVTSITARPLVIWYLSLCPTLEHLSVSITFEGEEIKHTTWGGVFLGQHGRRSHRSHQTSHFNLVHKGGGSTRGVLH